MIPHFYKVARLKNDTKNLKNGTILALLGHFGNIISFTMFLQADKKAQKKEVCKNFLFFEFIIKSFNQSEPPSRPQKRVPSRKDRAPRSACVY